MAMNQFVLDGRVYRTKVDYQLALKDKNKIEQLKRDYEYPNYQKLPLLYEKLKEQKSKFYTLQGEDFKEEVEGLLEKNNSPVKAKGDKKKIPHIDVNEIDDALMLEIQKEIKRKEGRRKLVMFLCCLIAISSFLYVGYVLHNDAKSEQLYLQLVELRDDILNQSDEGSNTYTVTLDEAEEKELTILPEYEALYNKNKKLIGWIKIDDTNIDYPVLQTSDNEYYLTHNINQEYDKNGSIFLDKDCDIINRNTNLIIYGHRMSSGSMFGTLDSYKSEDFYEEHKYISFDTIYEKGTYEVVYAFQTQIYKESEITFKFYQFYDVNSEQEFDSYMKSMSELSIYDTGITPTYGDELITLATCDYYTTYGRFVVVARKI